jgi:DNA-nicking Smr family endonuclease
MRRLSGEDAGLWRRAMRDVAPLAGRPLKHPPLQAGEGGSARSGDRVGAVPGDPTGISVKAQQPTVGELPPLDRLAGVDRATAERLKRGRRPVEASLDLHGLTQAEAHRALAAFIAGSRAAGRRCVLVVTGHGRLSGGVLKAAVPRWLEEPDLRRDVLAIAPARPQHGGHGALYVLLRRSRNSAE